MDLQKEREAFEKWAENNGYHIEKKDGNYVVTSTIHCWLAWQAKAQAVPEGFVLVKKTNRIGNPNVDFSQAP